MPSASLFLFDPRRTIQLQGFSGRAATTTLHDATETGFQISGIFQAAEDFANVQLFSAHDYFIHLRLKPLPVTDLSGLTLQYDMEILRVNGEEGNVRPDCIRYASVGWDKLTITTGAGDIYEVQLMSHGAVVSGVVTPGKFGFELQDQDAATLDELLVGQPTPALTDKVHVYFMGTRWSCSSAEAIAFCSLETALTHDIGNPDAPSTAQAIWWQGDPDFYHSLAINSIATSAREGDFATAVEIAQYLAGWFPSNGFYDDIVEISSTGNEIIVSLKPGIIGPVWVATNSGSAPASLTRFVPGIYTARVASSAEFRVGDYVGVDIGNANDEVLKVISVGSGTFSAQFTRRHLAGAVCRLLPRARHFGRVLKSRMVDAPASDYGDQPASLAVDEFRNTDRSATLKLKLAGPLGQHGSDANGMPVRVSVDGENKIVRIEKKDGEFGATSFTTAVEGAGNDRVYRFTFPFASLSGYRNGDRNSLVPVPATDIVKVHLTFAPRFEDVENGLAAGGRLKDGVAASPPGTEEEWHASDAGAMLAGLKYYVGTSNAEERITCLANFGLVLPDPEDPATWYYRLLVRRGEDSSTPQAWPPGTRIQRISTITGTRSDIEWQVRISNLTVTGDRTLKVGSDAPRIEESDGRCRYAGFWEVAPQEKISKSRRIGGSGVSAEREPDLLDGFAANLDASQVGRSEAQGFGDQQRVFAVPKGRRPAARAGIIAHQRRGHGVGGDRVGADNEQARPHQPQPVDPRALAAGHGLDAIDQRKMHRAGGHQFRGDVRDPIAGVPRGGRIEFRRRAARGLAFPQVAHLQPSFGGTFVGRLAPRVVTVNGSRGDAEAVLQRQRDAASRMVLQLGHRHEHVGLLVSRVQLVSREDPADAGHLEARVALAFAQRVRVLELDVRGGAAQGPDVPAGIEQVFLQRPGRPPAAFHKADPARPGAAQQMRHGARGLRVGVVGHTRRLALETQPRAARQVQLDGDGLVAHQAFESADLIELPGQHRGNVLLVGGAEGHGHGGRRRLSAKPSGRAEGGEPFASGHVLLIRARV
jgi:hypothetical protein